MDNKSVNNEIVHYLLHGYSFAYDGGHLTAENWDALTQAYLEKLVNVRRLQMENEYIKRQMVEVANKNKDIVGLWISTERAAQERQEAVMAEQERCINLLAKSKGWDLKRAYRRLYRSVQ